MVRRERELSGSAATAPGASLPAELRRDIEAAGYYPALVSDVVGDAVAGEDVRSHLVHQETTFDGEEVIRHVTVLALTAGRLVVVHADDHGDDHGADAGPEVALGRGPVGGVATATSECVPVSAVRGVMVTHVVEKPGAYRPGSRGREITLTVGWGAVARLDIVPASCGDPDCVADHGYEGTVASDDITLRVSATADGAAALQQALDFARALSGALGLRAGA